MDFLAIATSQKRKEVCAYKNRILCIVGEEGTLNGLIEKSDVNTGV